MPDIKPIRPNRRCEVLSAGQVSEIKAATLHVLEHVGVHFPSQRALSVFAEHGARVDWETEVVRLTPDLVRRGHEPRPALLHPRRDESAGPTCSSTARPPTLARMAAGRGPSISTRDGSGGRARTTWP